MRIARARSLARWVTLCSAVRHVGSSSSLSTVAPWTQIRAAAGPPPPARLFDEAERLFGATKPEIVFWRDSAGWCPFCEMTWLVLEAMRLPYKVRTVPLRRYMLDGEQKDPEYTSMVGPDGVVPGLQFWSEDTRSFNPAVQSIERIFDELRCRYPSRFPECDGYVRSRACEGDGSIFGRLRVARRSYEACAGANSSDLSELTPLASALADLDCMLAASEPPDACADRQWWLDGACASPSVADLMLLPLLERTAAVVPYFYGGGVLTRDLPFGRAAAYLERARLHHAAYAALCSDATTLARTNLRYAQAGATPRYGVPSLVVDVTAAAHIDGTDTTTCDTWAAEATVEARRDAATRLARRPSRIASFARRCVPGAVIEDGTEEALDGALDGALRAAAALLLRPRTMAGASAVAEARQEALAMAAALQHEYGSDAAAEAAAALVALSVNVGVPRDMSVHAAQALRSHVRMVADALDAARAEDTVAMMYQGGRV